MFHFHGESSLTVKTAALQVANAAYGVCARMNASAFHGHTIHVSVVQYLSNR